MPNPLLSPALRHHVLNFSAITPAHFDEAFQILPGQVRAEHEALVLNAPLTFEALFNQDAAASQLGAVCRLLGHLTSVADTPELRELYETYMPDISRLYQELALDSRAYEKVKAFRHSEAFAGLPAIRQKIVDRSLKSYEQGGIHLPAEAKARMTDISARLDELGHQFSNHLTDFSSQAVLAFTRDELVGLPQRTLDNATVLEDGRLEISLVSGGFSDILTYCTVETTRKAVYECQLAKGVGEAGDNRPLLEEILALRQELAQLLGYDTFAQLQLEDNMAKTPVEAFNFAESLAAKSLPTATEEGQQLDAFGADLLGRTVTFWDRSFVYEKLQQARYAVDTEALRQYFPVDRVVSGLFALLNDLYAIQFVADATLSTWHPDVLAYRVEDSDTGRLRGTLYLDLYRRKHKDGGAWMNPTVNRHVSAEGTRLPVVYIVCNAPKDKAATPTFTFDEVVTLFHEMGHALHNLLTEVDEEFFSGLAHVEHDAVELPSQFMENFCWDYSVLERMTAHVDTGAPLPKEDFDQLKATRLFMAASGVLHSARLSLMDLTLHLNLGVAAEAIEREVLERWKIREIDPRIKVLPSFSHIFAGGYAAGYYAYQWAEMLSADAFAALKETGATAAEQRERALDFRYHILATGGVDSMADNFARFRGRAPDLSIFLADNGIAPVNIA